MAAKLPRPTPLEDPFVAARKLRRKGKDRAQVAETLAALGLAEDRVTLVCNTVFYRRRGRARFWERWFR